MNNNLDSARSKVPFNSKTKYRTDIDGLRGWAVLLIVVYHLGLLPLSGGFIGVDVFFVISGYLITTILVADYKRRGFISLVTFFERRARRLLPALIVVLAVCLLIGVVVLLPSELTTLSRVAFGAVFFVANIVLWREAGYFFEGSGVQPLLHTWSLGIEEQFYVLWPICLSLLLRWPRYIVASMGALIVVSFALSVIFTPIQPTAAFYLLPTRAWELGIGSILVFLSVGAPSKLLTLILQLSGFLGIMGAAIFFDEQTPIPGYAALLPVLASALLIYSGQNQSVVGRILFNQWMVFIGKISYSLYLIHWPLIAFTNLVLWESPPLGARLAIAFISVGLGYCSWRWVEQPWRSTQSQCRIRHLLIGSFILAASILLIYQSEGLPTRFSKEVVAADQAQFDTNPMQSKCHRNSSFVGVNINLSTHCIVGDIDAPRIVLWGDSHADHLAPAVLEYAQQQRFGFQQLSMSNCPPLPSISIRNALGLPEMKFCDQFNNDVLDTILSSAKVQVVILSARWSRIDEIDAALEYVTSRLQGSGVAVWTVGQAPEARFNIASCLAGEAIQRPWFGAPDCALAADNNIANKHQATLRLQAGLHGACFVSTLDKICSENACALKTPDNRYVYSDSNHLTVSAVRSFLLPEIKRCANVAR